jgi:hypothetical protein
MLKEFRKQDSVVKIAISLTVVGIAVLLIFLVTLFFNGLINFSFKISPENASHLGDFFGGFFGSIWALVGVILLYKTLTLQTREFRENQKLLQQQSFDSIFFKLLSRQKELIENLLCFSDGSLDKYYGQQFFSHLKSTIMKKTKNKILSMPFDERFSQATECFERNFSGYFHNFTYGLDEYVTNLTLIFDFIEDGKQRELFDADNFYTKILLSSITEDEAFYLINRKINFPGREIEKYILEYKIADKVKTEEQKEYFVPSIVATI